MPALRIKRRADRRTRALKQLASIKADIMALPDEDLLDLVDIYMSRTTALIGEIAQAEMNKRGLSL